MAAWNVYAKELYHHGHGYPLWVPDPEPRTNREVEIADLGWIRDGQFIHLLRCKATQEDSQPHQVQPEDYAPFNPPNLVTSGPLEKITQPVLCSRSIKNVEVQAGASVNVPMAVSTPGGNVKFQCTQDKGALLLLSPRGEETFIESKRHIVTYMREHLDSWEDLANSVLGLELLREDIFFVCGVTKTSRWGVAAFSGTQRNAQGTVSCDFGALGSASMNISVAQTSLPGSWYRSGPPRARGSPTLNFAPPPAAVPYMPYGASPTQPAFGTGSSTSVSSYGTAVAPSTASFPAYGNQTMPPGMTVPSVPQARHGVPEKADQCIFFHYYKAKRRFFLFERMEAGAGPHELPPKADDDFSSSEVLAQDDDGADELEFESSADDTPYDPVKDVLDYILETNQEVKLAIASDLDLYALFKDQDFPDDVAAELRRLKPAVELDENNVGTLSVDFTYSRKRVGEEEAEGSPSKKQAMSPGDAPDGGNHPEDMDIDYQPAYMSGGADDDMPQPSTGPQDPPVPDKGKEAARHVVGDPSTHDGSVTALAYSADGRYLATGAEDTCVIIWYAREGAVKRKLAAHDDTISALAFSPNAAILASASDYGPIKLWQVEALDQEPQVVDPGVFVRSLAFTPDGYKLLGGASDGRFIMWNVGNLARVDITHHAAVVAFIIFSADGTMMATGGTESVCRVWEVASLDSGTPKWVLKGHRGMVSSAAFSRDGRRIITGSDDASCRIWSTESGEVLVNLHEHTGPVWAVAFAPDGMRVVSGSSDTTVKVCDAWTGERRLSLDAHDNMINSVACSPDGLYIASASSDNTVRLWDAESGKLVRTYNEHSDNVTSVRFSPDGKTLASGAHDGTVYIRPLQQGEVA